MNKIDRFWEVIDKIAAFFLKKLLHIKFSDSQWEAFMQFVKFGVVGLTNTVISYSIYAFGLWTFKHLNILKGTDYIVAQVIAFVLSVLWSFYWNNKMVFQVEDGKKRNMWKALAKTYVSYSFTGLFLNTILLIFWVNIVGISEFIAPIINLLVSVPLNFIINKFWAFKTVEK